MKIILPVFVLVLLLTMLSSCGVSHQSTTYNQTQQEALRKLGKDKLNFKWLSAKAKMDYEDAKGSISSTLNIRCRKDSVIWLSFSLIGVEGARAMITPDSIKMVDRINKQYLIEPYSYLKKLVPYDVDFHLLQDLIAGDVIFYDSLKAVEEKTDEGYKIHSVKNTFTNDLLLDPVSFLVKSMNIIDTVSHMNIHVDLAGYQPVSNQMISFDRTIVIKAEENASAKLKFDKITLNDPVNFPFRIGEKYERIH